MWSMKTWLAFLVLNESESAFVGLSPWRDQVVRWCRRIVLSYSDGLLQDASVIFYSRDDRPVPQGHWSRGYRPFAWTRTLDERWRQEAVLRHPFDELFRGRRSRSNSPAFSGNRQRLTRPQRAASPNGPGTAFDELQFGTDQVEPAVAAAHNNLLTWLSAAGTGRWETFLRACQELGLAQDANFARRLIRRLILLGHLTLNEVGDRWTMQPPTVAPLAVDPELLVLRGQRSAEVMACLSEARESTPQEGAPDRVLCCIPLENGTPSISVAGVTFRSDQSAVERAQSLLDWRSWLTTLRHYDGRDLGRFTYTERWDNGAWVGSALYFDDATKHIVGPTGMYRLSREAQTRSPLTAFFDGERQIIVRGDWYGLRFLAGRAAGEQACAAWDPRSHALYVPVEGRWPLLYEQTLVQASGLLPGRSASWLCYHGIPQDLGESLCEKLDVAFQVIASPVSPECERAAF